MFKKMTVLSKIRVGMQALLLLQAVPRHLYGVEFEFCKLVVCTLICSSYNNN